MRSARWAARQGALRCKRSPRRARRARYRQDRAARARSRIRFGHAGPSSCGPGVRGRAGVRRAASALRADARSGGPPARPAAGGPGGRVRAERRRSARPLRRRAGDAESALGRRRGHTPSVRDRRRAMARRGVGPHAGVRRAPDSRRTPWRSCSPHATSATGSAVDCRSWCSTGSRPRTLVRCWRPGSSGWSTSRSATGSWPKRAATRSPCSSSPAALSAAELAGGFGAPGDRPIADRIEQSFLRRLESMPARTQQLLLIAAAEPIGDVALAVARGKPAGARARTRPTRPRPRG